MTNRPSTETNKSWRPIGMSLLTHAFLVILLLVFGFSATQTAPGEKLRRVGIVLTAQSENDASEYLHPSDPITEPEPAVDSEPTNPSSAPPPTIALPLETPDRPELPGFESREHAQLDANQMVDVTEPSKSHGQYELSEEDLEIIRSDQRLLRSRIPKGNPATISVFGSGDLTGRSFVFVIDRSKSMGTGGLGVIEAARTELSTAINQLEPNHRFQIVGYHERTVTIAERRLLPATESNKQLVPNFISKLAAFGATNHENGLIAAVAFKPDVIVLMTDGGYPELNAGQLKMLKRLAPQCQFHCLQFGIGPLQQKTNFMTRLAEQNKGTFRYIDVSKWERNQ